MPRMLIRLLAGFVIASTAGCGTTVIVVPQGTPVQLAEPVKAHVFVVQQDGTRVKSVNRIEIPAGWWAAHVPEPDPVQP